MNFIILRLPKIIFPKAGLAMQKRFLEKALGRPGFMRSLIDLTSSLQVRPFDFAGKADAGSNIKFYPK